jgi:hypothetical protein
MRILALLVLILALHAAELPFKPPVAYSCDMAMTDGGQKMTGRMVVGGTDKQRMEMKSTEGKVVMIMRKDLKKIFMLMPDDEMAMTMPFDPSKQQGFKDPTQDDKATWKKTGAETVNGVACDRYEWTSGSEKGTAWIDAKQSVMIRASTGSKGQADFSNYQIGAQKADLFEIPAGYQQMPGMGGMMGGQ